LRITEKDIANIANVSRGTVYRALHNKPGINPETKEKILKIVNSLDYKPNLLGKGLARKEKLKLGVITLPTKNPFSKELMAGINEAKEELKDFGLSLITHSMSDLSPQKQANKIFELIEKEVHGISIDAIDSPEVRNAVDTAAKSDIPVVTFNSDLKKSKRLCFVGQDLYGSGQVAADLLGKFMGVHGEVFILNGFHMFEAHQERLAGFQSVIENYSDIKVISIEEDLDDNVVAYDKTSQILERFPDLDGIYIVGAGIDGVGKAVKKFGRASKTKIVCNDLVPETVTLLQEDVIDATIFQDPVSQGKLPIKLLFDLLFDNIRPYREIYYTKTEIITKYLI
jgi:LacI family transcriptional regulator